MTERNKIIDECLAEIDKELAYAERMKMEIYADGLGDAKMAIRRLKDPAPVYVVVGPMPPTRAQAIKKHLLSEGSPMVARDGEVFISKFPRGS